MFVLPHEPVFQPPDDDGPTAEEREDWEAHYGEQQLHVEWEIER